jgi:hypothetical protein
MGYSPFEKPLDQLVGEDLSVLRDVSEGWYVEYKSVLIDAKSLAKSLSAFANHYGGWLVLGVLERDGVASSFPGLEKADVVEAELRLRNATKDCLNPSVFYSHRIINGPVSELGLPDNRALVVVHVPMGLHAPYVHNDGRIYRRVADASSPKPETDRAVLDLLWKRGADARKHIKKLTSRSPMVSKGESQAPFIHFFLSGDPLQQGGGFYRPDFDTFARLMRGNPIPFDNIFSAGDGYVARQVSNNDPHRRVFTWEYRFVGHSWVTLPMNASTELGSWFNGYDHFDRFRAMMPLNDGVPWTLKVLDLNVVFAAIGAVCKRHRQLLEVHGFHGPFYVKAHIENVWRCVPFLDTKAFVDFVGAHGVPVVQDNATVVPPGVVLESFLTLRKAVAGDRSDLEQQFQDSALLTAFVLAALGIPFEVFEKSTPELGYLLDRQKEVERLRANNPTSRRDP